MSRPHNPKHFVHYRHPEPDEDGLDVPCGAEPGEGAFTTDFAIINCPDCQAAGFGPDECAPASLWAVSDALDFYALLRTTTAPHEQAAIRERIARACLGAQR